MKNAFLLLVTLLFFASCQKVINIDLNSASPKYVIEGGVTNGSGPCNIKITKTKNFSENNSFEGIENASVSISDDAGNGADLVYTTDGIYQTNEILGIPGRTYNLTVKLGNETFASTSKMPYPVNMDTLYTFNFFTPRDTIKWASLEYRDPVGVKNYYRFILTLNQVVSENIYISDDQFNDGKKSMQYITYFNREAPIKATDSVRIEMQCIDAGVYNFFFTLDQTIGQSSAAPTNPISNISGGALGYFSAYTSQTKRIQIK